MDKLTFILKYNGDVGEKTRLSTQSWCKFCDVDDRISLMVTCNVSPMSKSCHRHRCGSITSERMQIPWMKLKQDFSLITSSSSSPIDCNQIFNSSFFFLKSSCFRILSARLTRDSAAAFYRQRFPVDSQPQSIVGRFTPGGLKHRAQLAYCMPRTAYDCRMLIRSYLIACLLDESVKIMSFY